MRASAFAPAKINLFLHVGPANGDGMHPLCSLMVFADVGDRVMLRPAEGLSLSVTGPFAAGLGAGDDNLVMRAARAIIARGGGAQAFHLTLDKQLPIAAGLGGGSSDAGAALRLLQEVLNPGPSDDDLAAAAAELGADGPACLAARPLIAEGYGERLSPAPVMPLLDAVLVNPGVASPTGPVYRMFDSLGLAAGAERPDLPDRFESAEDLAATMARLRNDLEPPAITLNPAIGQVMAALRDEPETLLARVSGSGATCFALCAGEGEAARLAQRVEQRRPDWWVRRCRLGGPW